MIHMPNNYVGLMFGTTKSLRSAFEEQRPWTTATLKNVVTVKLHEPPSHIRFTADEAYLIISMPHDGVFILDCSKLCCKVYNLCVLAYNRNLWKGQPNGPSRQVL